MKKKSVRANLLKVYVTVTTIVVMVIAVFATYSHLSKELEQFHENNQSALYETTTRVEQEFKQLDQYSVALSGMNWVRKIIHMQGGVLDLERFDLIALQDYNQSLTAYTVSNSFISAMALAFTSVDKVFYENTAIIPVDRYLSYTFHPGAAQRMQQELVLYHNGGIVYPVDTKYPINTSNAMVYIYTVPSINQNMTNAQAVYSINMQRLERVAATSGVNEHLLMFTYGNQIILNNSTIVIDPLTQQQIYMAKPGQRLKLEQGAFYVYTDRNASNKLEYALLAPESRLWSTIYQTAFFYLLLYIMILCIGIFVITRWTIRTIKPIDEVFGLIRRNYLNNLKAENWTGSIDDQTMFKIVQDMIDDRHLADTRLFQRNAAIAMNNLRSYITGDTDRDINDIEQELNDCGISFPFKHFLCIIIRYRAGGHGGPCQLPGPDNADDNEDVVVVMNAASCDILVANSGDPGCAEIYEKYYADLVNGSANGDFYVAIGSCMQSLGAMPESYSAALRASNQKLLEPERQVFTKADINSPVNFHYYPVEKEMSIMNCLKKNKPDEACSVLENLLTMNVSVMRVSPQGIISFFLDVYNTGSRVLYEQAIDPEQHEILEKGPRDLLSCDNIQGMMECTSKLFNRVAEILAISHLDHGGRLKDKIESYLNDNYANPHISLQSLSDHLELSVSHVSRVFNNLFDVSLVSYINRLRIEESIQLLNDHTLAIHEIPQKVGYGNSVTFRRCFKSIMGMSPQEYRDSLVTN